MMEKLGTFYEHILTASRQTGLPAERIAEEIFNGGVRYLHLSDPDIARLVGSAAVAVRWGFRVNDLSLRIPPHGLRFDAVEAEEHICAAVETGARELLLLPWSYTELALGSISREQVLRAFGDLLAFCCETAARYGATVLIEDYDHFDTPCAYSDEMLALVRCTPGLGVAFDTGNFIHGGEDMWQAFLKLSPYIRNSVHLKDRAFRPLEENAPCFVSLRGKASYPVPVGSGEIALLPVLRAINSKNYQGVLYLEHFGAQDQLAYLRRSIAWIRKTLADISSD